MEAAERITEGAGEDGRLAIATGVECRKLGPEGASAVVYNLINEEPLLIRVGDKSLVTLMCTPGDEVSLAFGYLYTEGVIGSAGEVGAVAFCREESGNVVRVIPADGADFTSRLTAHRAVFSSCSICGQEAIASVTSCLKPFRRQARRLSAQAIFELGSLMNDRQRLFKRTGGAHAAVLVQINGGKIVPESAILKEDVGRHNALDKAVGEALRRNVSFENSLLLLSGRMSFEMVAKAARAGISDIAAISAPTALAVRLAEQLNMCLTGTARGESGIVYTGEAALTVK